MEKQRLTTLINQPEKLTEPDLQHLQQLRKEYPYFQAVSPLITIASKKFDPKRERKYLQSAAIYSLDRKHLKNLLFTDNHTNGDASEETQKQTTKIELKSEIETKKESPQPLQEVKPQPIKITKTAHTESAGNLPDSFFEELFNDMLALKASKENYKKVLADMDSGKTSPLKKEVKKSPPVKVEKAEQEKKIAPKKKSKSSKSKNPALNKNENPTSKTADPDIIAELSNLKEKKISDAHKREQIEIINNFIDLEPVISKKISSDTVVPKKKIEDLSEASTNLSDDVVSETLAKLMIKQGRKPKAIEIYKKLIWKFPQKKTYFVEIIEALKKES